MTRHSGVVAKINEYIFQVNLTLLFMNFLLYLYEFSKNIVTKCVNFLRNSFD